MKLVRDRIPELAATNGHPNGSFHQAATEAEYALWLRAKLLEEAQEAATAAPAGLVEELGDVLQVLYALVELAGCAAAEVECARVRKARTHGSYTRRLVWQPPPTRAGAGHAEPPPHRASRASRPAPHGGSPMTAPATAPPAQVAPIPHGDRVVRLLAVIRVTLVAALTVLVLAIAALAYVVSFEAIRAFAIETAAFPPALAWSAPLLVDSFTTAASLVILWRYLRGDRWHDPWYAWTLVGAATAVSVALNVAHAPERLAAQLFAALPPVALLGALELLMSVARTGLPHTNRTPAPTPPIPGAPGPALDRTPSGNGHRPPAALASALPQGRTSAADPDTAAAPDVRSEVRALVARERSGGPTVTAAEVIAVTGRSRRRAYELLREARAEGEGTA